MATPSGELPEPVLERLSQVPRMALLVGEDTATATHVALAPLSRQTFLLVPRGSPTEAALLVEPRVTLSADDPKGDWTIRVTGRVVVSRPVTSEPRRAELIHWLPEGAAPSGIVAARLHAETLEYITGKGSARTRAAGPVPGGAAPAPVSRWVALASEGVVVVYFGALAADWGGLLLLIEEEKQRILLLFLMALSSFSLLAGLNVLEQGARLARWREGLVDEAGAGLLVRGWEGRARVQAVGSGMMALGVVLAVALALGAGWKVGAWAVLASAVPVLAPFLVVRHASRRRDAARESG